MRISLALSLLVACSGAAREPAEVNVTAKLPPPAPPTCAEIGIIMRGDVEPTAPDAGLEREKAIERSCAQDHWPQSVIDCAASTTAPDDCLDALSKAQHASYE